MKTGIALLVALMVSLAQAAPPDVVHAAGTQSRPAPAALLRAKYASLTDALKSNPYNRPLHVESMEQESSLKGDVFAVVPYPFAAVASALTEAAPWCDILILPVTTKGCRAASRAGAGATLSLRIGLKYEQSADDAFPLEFAYRVTANSPQYFSVQLEADTGPLGTRDYRVLVEAVPVEAGKTFLHLRYAYAYGTAGRLAMQAYLATLGAGKVGFTLSNGKLTGGMRGVIERNAMRFHLAIDAHLAAASAPAVEQVDRRLKTWFDSTEQYARQLHEMSRDEYVAMKRREVQRQRAPQDIVRALPTSERF